MDKLENQFWRKEKLKELDELLIACTGLYMEAVASESSATPGAALDLSIEVVNRSPIDIKLMRCWDGGQCRTNNSSSIVKRIPERSNLPQQNE